jgi:hypothetical protein
MTSSSPGRPEPDGSMPSATGGASRADSRYLAGPVHRGDVMRPAIAAWTKAFSSPVRPMGQCEGVARVDGGLQPRRPGTGEQEAGDGEQEGGRLGGGAGQAARAPRFRRAPRNRRGYSSPLVLLGGCSDEFDRSRNSGLSMYGPSIKAGSTQPHYRGEPENPSQGRWWSARARGRHVGAVNYAWGGVLRRDLW